MKLLYVVTTYVEAESAAEAARLVKNVKAHEVNLHGKWWENNNFALREDHPQQVGFSAKGKHEKRKVQPTSPQPKAGKDRGEASK